MNKKTGFLILTTVVLGACYAYFFTDWFQSKKIQIMYRNLSERQGGPSAPTFYIDPPAPLKTITVFEETDYTTNKYPHPLWKIVATNSAVLTEDIQYGHTHKGMKPAVDKTVAEPLSPTKAYLLVVEGDKIKGERKFQLQTPTK